MDYREIHTVIIFGSSLKNHLKVYSDIDIAIAAEEVLSFKRIRKLVETFNGRLSHSVDLIDLNAVSGPILREALCSGDVMKKSLTIFFAKLIKKMWYI